MEDVEMQGAQNLRRSSRRTQPAQRNVTCVTNAPPQTRTRGKKTLEHWLQNPKSALAHVDMANIVNVQGWSRLTPEAQQHLCSLLPPTAFTDFKPRLFRYEDHKKPQGSDDDHQGPISNNAASGSIPRNPLELLDLSVLNETSFIDAARTFQDHLYSGWFSDGQREKLSVAEEALRNGVTSVPWKDEVWLQEHGHGTNSTSLDGTREQEGGLEGTGSTTNASKSGVGMFSALSTAVAGDAAEVKLGELITKQVLKAGDIISYKRHFSVLKLVVEKDVFIDAIHPKSQTLDVLMEPETTQSLPWEIIAPLATRDGPERSGRTQSMSINTLASLETAILDTDGRVEKGNRPNGNAWKTMSLWQWPAGIDPAENMNIDGAKGGRECQGTLFYLRATYYYHER